MTFQNQLALLVVCCLSVASAEVTPTCADVLAQQEIIGETWSFPNDCVVSCTDLGSTMDLVRSQTVGDNLKCFCVDIAKPFCTDRPYCSDLGIFPGTNQREYCDKVCGEGASDVTANLVQYTTGVDDNKYQFDFVVSCECSDYTRITKKCGDDLVVLSDLDDMKSCSGNDANSLNITNSDECHNFCRGKQIFSTGQFCGNSCDEYVNSCTCYSLDITSEIGPTMALVCEEDVTARDSPAASSATSAPASNFAAKTLLSSTAIMGVWLLPW